MISTELPLSSLRPWDGNIRKTDINAGIEELAASIKAHGLLNPVTVRERSDGGYDVIAGNRRLSALTLLAEQGSLDKDSPVEAHIFKINDEEAREISLAENVVRRQIHPADEFEAFNHLAEEGRGVSEIAAAFGVTEKHVQKRMKLAKVSPVIIQAFRRNELGVEQVQAFAVIDSIGDQEKLFKRFDKFHDYQTTPSSIRRALTEKQVRASDHRMKFIGIEAYKDAGGTVRSDLFVDSAEGIFVENPKLLDELFKKKIKTLEADLKLQGWANVKVIPKYSYGFDSGLDRVDPSRKALSAEDKLERDRLEKILTELRKDYNSTDDETQEEILSEKIEQTDSQIEAIENKYLIYPQHVKEKGTCFIILDDNGSGVSVRMGYVSRAAKKALEKKPDAKTKQSAKKSANDDDNSPSLSSALVTDLSKHKSAAIAASLAANPKTALAYFVYELGATVFYDEILDDELLNIDLKETEYGLDPSPAGEIALMDQHKILKNALPKKFEEFYDWCMKQTEEILLRYFGYIVGMSVSTIFMRADDDTTEQDRLAVTLGVDMTKWFVPTAENYYGRVSKGLVLSALKEVLGKPAEAWANLDKAKLTEAAEREIKASGKKWLPKLLRLPAAKEKSPAVKAIAKSAVKKPAPKKKAA